MGPGSSHYGLDKVLTVLRGNFIGDWDSEDHIE